MASFTQAFELAEQQVNAKGAKFCPLSSKGERVHLTLGSRDAPLQTQWGPSSFDASSTSTRCNFDFVCDEKLTQQLQQVDTWAKAYIEKHSQRLFGKVLTAQQVNDNDKPILIERGSYPSQLRCKINMAGSKQVRCWDENGQPRPPPQDWKNCKFVARVNLSHLWLMSREMGWVVNITDLQIFEDQWVCPFM